MKFLLKSLIVWLMLLAVPFQGFASATMLFCAPIQAPAAPAAAHAPAHDHHAMLMAQAAAHAHHAAGGAVQAHHHAAGDDSSGHHGGKCNSCATCCFGAAMIPSHASPIAADTQHFAALPFDVDSFPAVDLAHPDRPPKASLA